MPKPPSSYWLLIRQRFLRNKRAKWSVRLLLFLVLVAFLGDFIAGEVPIYCKLNNQHYFPAFKKQAVDWGIGHWSKPFQNPNWQELDYQSVFFPLIPYAGSTMDKKNRRYKSPFGTQEITSLRFRHWLGTDGLGRDIAAGLIEGLKVALKVGLLSMLLSSLIGVFLGGMAGYFGDDRFVVSWGRLILNSLALLLSIHFAFIARQYALSEGHLLVELFKSMAICGVIFLIANGIARLLDNRSFFSKSITLPIDVVVMRIVEVLNAIPGLLLILALTAIIKKPSIYTLIGIIGILSWTGIARFIRAELLKIRSIEYIQSAKAMGFSHWRILFKHALPNAIGPVLITVAFGIAGAILAEATLSFLGIGIPSGQVTWGTLLAKARNAPPSAWWLAVFPGLAIFTLVLIFNLIGEGLKEAIDSRE